MGIFLEVYGHHCHLKNIDWEDLVKVKFVYFGPTLPTYVFAHFILTLYLLSLSSMSIHTVVFTWIAK